ncbi:MAG TPA: aminotransferase class I/II-fold pyridoxal phosphate-dependent enzyme, partial [Anaerolineae bacterium]|nr:aminotransferase class I/II-fold pyridoxal phosphate-dependent enzyme [Anaerolineae bacterium]
MTENNYKIETLAIHVGQDPDPATGAVIPPIYQTSTFVQLGVGENLGYRYSRVANPTRTALEANLAALERARYGLAFASGMAAIDTVFRLLRPGDHAIVADDVYGGAFRLLETVLKPAGIEHTFVDLTDLEKLRQAIRPNTKLVWLETPTNPSLKLIDIAALSEIAHA